MNGTWVAAIVIGIVVLTCLFILGWGVATSNNLKKMKIKIEESASDIEVALTKRYDVLTKQLDVVKGYTKHEKSTFVDITKLRVGEKETKEDIKSMMETNTQLNELAKQIAVEVERYPDIKADKVFANLQESVTDVEEHLQASRRLYNSNVSRYNSAIVVFPNSIIANMIKATKSDFFEAEDIKKSDVKMDF